MHTTYQEANKYMKSITSIVITTNIHLITCKVIRIGKRVQPVTSKARQQ